MPRRRPPLSEDLCWVIVHMAKTLSPKEIMLHTELKQRTPERILSVYRHTGCIVNRSDKPRGRKSILDEGDSAFLLSSIAREPDVYLDELKEGLEERCGKEVSLSTVWRALQKSGFTMKKITKVAKECCETKHAAYVHCIGQNYIVDQLVFVDESAFDRRTSYRGYGWALKGQRALRKTFFMRGKRYSILPAISHEGMIAIKIVEGSFDTELFTEFIEGLLDRMQPFLAENSVIVMDNCRIHKNPAIIQLIEERGMHVEFLPPYLPDYNPIELAFLAIKAHIKCKGDIV